MFKDNSIHLCKFCSEITNGVLCPTCKTKDQRKIKILKQLEIEKENETKGFKISNRLFMFDRCKLLKEYGIK